MRNILSSLALPQLTCDASCINCAIPTRCRVTLVSNDDSILLHYIGNKHSSTYSVSNSVHSLDGAENSLLLKHVASSKLLPNIIKQQYLSPISKKLQSNA